jgi:hypothetical protein
MRSGFVVASSQNVLRSTAKLCSAELMTTRTAQCACGRVTITVENEPLRVLTCHCDFCQKRTGSVLQVSAQFAEEQVVETRGDTKTYNGLELDGVGEASSGIGINYYFCTTCGSTIYWDFIRQGQQIVGIAVGNFVDPDFPAPTLEFNTRLRHHWVRPVPAAQQFDTVSTA